LRRRKSKSFAHFLSDPKGALSSIVFYLQRRNSLKKKSSGHVAPQVAIFQIIFPGFLRRTARFSSLFGILFATCSAANREKRDNYVTQLCRNLRS